MENDHVDRILEQWRRERPDINPSPMGIVGRVKRLAALFERATSATFARHGLEPGEFDVLAALLRTGAPHRLPAGQLGRELMITSGTVTNRIDRLEAAGMVRRCDHPEDRRSTLVALTPAGRHRVDEALADHLETEQALIAALSESKKAQLVAVLRGLLLALGDSANAKKPVGSLVA